MNLTNDLKSHFLNLYHMALSDYEVDSLELAILYRIGEEKGISSNEIHEIVLRPSEFRFSIPKTVSEKIECLYDFARIAWADEKVDSNERRLLQMFCSKFGFEDDNIPTITQFLLDEAEKGTSIENILKIVSENI